MKSNTSRSISTLCKAAMAVAIGGAALPSFADCIQDQYGNQYTLVFDTVHRSITGTAMKAQCDGHVWPLIGSYSGDDFNQRLQTLTWSNATDHPGCIDGPTMLKGRFPNFAWYYADGYGAQKSQFVACTAAAAADTSSPGQGDKR